MNINYYFLLYIIYSFLGWCMEVLLTLFEKKKFVNRGFLIGPYCPIYGKGALLVLFLLKNYKNNPLVLFLLSIFICSVIEYSGSYILEKVFNTSWWNYSSRKYNINGRICLETMIPFGIGCLLLTYYINPFICNILNKFSMQAINITSIIIFIIYLIDVIISMIIILKFKKISKDCKKDSTEIVTEYVKEEIIKGKKKLQIRLLKAFPNLKIRH